MRTGTILNGSVNAGSDQTIVVEGTSNLAPRFRQQHLGKNPFGCCPHATGITYDG